MKKLCLFISVVMITALNVSAQSEAADTIYTRSGTSIVCKVKEIGAGLVKYLQPEINSDVVYVIETNNVSRIVFYNGKVQTFGQNSPIEEIENNSLYLFDTQRRKALKLDFLSLAFSTFTLTYEQCLRPGRSLEFSAGYIGTGPGVSNDNPSGILLRGGYKLMRNPDYYIQGMRYSHILKGAYVKLELDFASYSVEKDVDSGSPSKLNNTKYAILIVFGNQWVFNDRMMVDLYSGFGLGGNNLEGSDSTYPYGFATLDSNFPLAFSFGLRLGFLLK